MSVYSRLKHCYLVVIARYWTHVSCHHHWDTERSLVHTLTFTRCVNPVPSGLHNTRGSCKQRRRFRRSVHWYVLIRAVAQNRISFDSRNWGRKRHHTRISKGGKSNPGTDTRYFINSGKTRQGSHHFLNLLAARQEGLRFAAFFTFTRLQFVRATWPTKELVTMLKSWGLNNCSLQASLLRSPCLHGDIGQDLPADVAIGVWVWVFSALSATVGDADIKSGALVDATGVFAAAVCDADVKSGALVDANGVVAGTVCCDEEVGLWALFDVVGAEIRTAHTHVHTRQLEWQTFPLIKSCQLPIFPW